MTVKLKKKFFCILKSENVSRKPKLTCDNIIKKEPEHRCRIQEVLLKNSLSLLIYEVARKQKKNQKYSESYEKEMTLALAPGRAFRVRAPTHSQVYVIQKEGGMSRVSST